MRIKHINDKKKWVIYQSLREQYNSGRPMGDAEEKIFWELDHYFWAKGSGKRKVGQKIIPRQVQ